MYESSTSLNLRQSNPEVPPYITPVIIIIYDSYDMSYIIWLITLDDKFSLTKNSSFL